MRVSFLQNVKLEILVKILECTSYNYQVKCKTHGIIPNEPSLCIIREGNDNIKNGLIKRTKYVKKKHLIKFSFSIGEFHQVYYQPILKNYSYHKILLCLLVKHKCKNLIRKYCLE